MTNKDSKNSRVTFVIINSLSLYNNSESYKQRHSISAVPYWIYIGFEASEKEKKVKKLVAWCNNCNLGHSSLAEFQH